MAVKTDIDEIFSLTHIAQQNNSRQKFIQQSVAIKNCYIASYEQIVGYAVFEYSFVSSQKVVAIQKRKR